MTPTPPAFDPAAYWSTRLAADSSLEAVGWRGLGRAFNRRLYRQRLRVLARVTAAYGWAGQPPRVLEIGPGTGVYVRAWQRLGVRALTGVDIAPPAVERLRQRFPGYRFVAGAAATVPLEPASFEVATAFDVLFHIVDQAEFEATLAAIARALVPGGLLLLTDMFPEAAPPPLLHHVTRSAATYTQALAAHGLRLERAWPVFVLMHPWTGARGRLARRAGRGWWAAVERIAGHVPGGGRLLGALLEPLDALLTGVLPATPSTTLWAVRRVA